MPEGKRHSPNPKRVAAEDSMCIRKSPPTNISSNISMVSNLAAIGEEAPAFRKTAGSQTAESAKWFDESNKNVSSERGTKFYTDDDSPYFLRHKSSSDESLPNPHRAPPSALSHMLRHRALHNAHSQNQTVESSSEDFRSVIDDLTLENRKLKKKLKKYEQVHCGQLHDDKLFEIRVHGLPAAKKRKLEKTLQEFASSLVDTVDDDYPSTFSRKLAKVPAGKQPALHNAASSSTSNSRKFADSAYASMSNSSNAQLSRGDSGRASVAGAANDHAIKHYLQSISKGLQPKHPPVLTEKARNQLIVQRLEQIFTGSLDSSTKHSQSKQQQEVSQSAANADRKESEAQGHLFIPEGRREAKIFTYEDQATEKPVNLDRVDTDSSGATTNSNATPDQRPTRPLDLDPSRAQVPEENIEYMKHLGFASPQMQETVPSEDEGWIFLNLLTGMAQLHILNVTPETVRSAVRECSTQLELSTDGSHIRWKGGKRPTLMTSDSGEVSAHSSNYSYDLVVPQTDNSKSSKSLENRSGAGSGNNQSSNNTSSSKNNKTSFSKHRPILVGETNPTDQYQYKPLFYHDRRSDSDGGHSFDDKASAISSGIVDSTMLDTEGGKRDGNTKGRLARPRSRTGTDAIIFYNKAKFYTDLSKDDESMPFNCPLYNKHVKTVVGVDDSSDDSGHEDRGALSGSRAKEIAPMERIDSIATLGGLIEVSQDSSSFQAPKKDIPFEASGIGGVVPGDNFAVEVEVEIAREASKKKVATKIISSKTTEMIPSALPPPSYSFLPFSSSSGSDHIDDESEESEETDNEDEYEQDIETYIPPRFLNSFSSAESSEDPDVDNMSDDSSIDMLAHARETEPETVAAAEREFDENNSAVEQDETMDIDPPASSVVATIGERSFEQDDKAAVPKLPTKADSKSSAAGRRRARTFVSARGKGKQRSKRA